MKKLIEFFIKYPVGVDALLIGFFLFGYISYNNLNTTFFPLVESRNVTITMIYPGASPQEIEEGVVNKIEQNLKGLTGVEQYTSTSNENSASIDVQVLKGYDTDLVLEDVKNAVQNVASFPTDRHDKRSPAAPHGTFRVSCAKMLPYQGCSSNREAKTDHKRDREYLYPNTIRGIRCCAKKCD